MDAKTFALAAFAAVLLLFAAGCAQQAPPQGPMVGNDSDSHGCIGSAGYSWCESSQKCIRSWEENCTAQADYLMANALPFCNMTDISSVSVCGSHVKVVSSLDGGGTAFYSANGTKTICPVVSPSAMSEQCKLLLLGNDCVEQKVC